MGHGALVIGIISLSPSLNNPISCPLVSTSVEPLGSGLGGGVELSLYNIAKEIIRRGHDLQIVAAADSTWDDLPIMQISGNLQIIAPSLERETSITLLSNPVLANLWDYDLSLYQLCSEPKQQFAWLGRISPEKRFRRCLCCNKQY